jgi:hypothetical protein
LNKKKISKLIKFIPLIVILIGLLITNGPLWIYFALVLWIIFFILWAYLFSKIFNKILVFSIEKFDKFFEKRRKKPTPPLSKKITIYCNKFNKIMYSYILPIIIALLLFLTIFNYSNYMAMMSTIKSELNRGEFEQLVDDIIKVKEDNISKTKAILAWFDENSHNIYNDYRLWDEETLIGKFYDGQIELYSTYPYIGIRTYSDDLVLWVLTSRYGHCGEYATFFREMADYAGLKARKVCSDGENHCWDEVYIDDTIGWKTVDPTAVFLNEEKNGYDNINRSYMRSRLGGNLSYVGAQEKGGNTYNITSLYTTEVNITVITMDKDNNIIPDVTVKLFSNNRYDEGRYTNIKGVTNIYGNYTFTIGMGNYTFKASKGNLLGENSSIFSKEILHNTIKICVE